MVITNDRSWCRLICLHHRSTSTKKDKCACSALVNFIPPPNINNNNNNNHSNHNYKTMALTEHQTLFYQPINSFCFILYNCIASRISLSISLSYCTDDLFMRVRLHTVITASESSHNLTHSDFGSTSCSKCQLNNKKHCFHHWMSVDLPCHLAVLNKGRVNVAYHLRSGWAEPSLPFSPSGEIHADTDESHDQTASTSSWSNDVGDCEFDETLHSNHLVNKNSQGSTDAVVQLSLARLPTLQLDSFLWSFEPLHKHIVVLPLNIHLHIHRLTCFPIQPCKCMNGGRKYT